MRASGGCPIALTTGSQPTGSSGAGVGRCGRLGLDRTITRIAAPVTGSGRRSPLRCGSCRRAVIDPALPLLPNFRADEERSKASTTPSRPTYQNDATGLLPIPVAQLVALTARWFIGHRGAAAAGNGGPHLCRRSFWRGTWPDPSKTSGEPIGLRLHCHGSRPPVSLPVLGRCRGRSRRSRLRPCSVGASRVATCLAGQDICPQFPPTARDRWAFARARTPSQSLGSRTATDAARAADGIGDAVASALSGMADRLRGGATSAGRGAAKLGQDALRRLTDEAEHRPLVLMAVAVGVGILIGLSIPRHS